MFVFFSATSFPAFQLDMWSASEALSGLVPNCSCGAAYDLRFYAPHSLPCAHTFCLTCLSKEKQIKKRRWVPFEHFTVLLRPFLWSIARFYFCLYLRVYSLIHSFQRSNLKSILGSDLVGHLHKNHDIKRMKHKMQRRFPIVPSHDNSSVWCRKQH